METRLLENFIKAIENDRQSLNTLTVISVNAQQFEMAATLRDMEVYAIRKIVDTWGVIIDNAFENITEEQRKNLCIYCDRFAKEESRYDTKYGIANRGETLLPVGLKVLSKLDLTDVEIIVSDEKLESITTTVEVDLSIEDIWSASEVVDKIVVNESVKTFEKLLKNNDMLVLHSVCKSVSYISEAAFPNMLIVGHSVEFKQSALEEKLEKIRYGV